MKIKTLIMWGLGACLSLMVLLGGAGIYELKSSISKGKQIVDSESRVVEYSQQLRANLNAMRRFEKDTFININDHAKVGEYLVKWNGASEKVKNCLEALKKLEDEPEHLQMLVAISKEVEEYKNKFNDVIRQIKNGNITSPESANKAIQSDKELIHLAEVTIESFAISNDKNINKAKYSLDDGISRAIIMFSLLTAACLIVALVGGIKLIRFIDQLQAEQHMLHRAVEQSPVTVVLTDINGTIEYVNPHFTELTGYFAKEAVGQNPRILKSDQTPPEVYEKLWSAILSGKTWKGEFLNKGKDGTLFWEQATISPITDQYGNMTHFLAVKENITEKKELLEQLTASKELAEAANTAKSQFLANMSHEIRTPMNGVIGMTSLLLDTELTSEQRECAEIIRKSGEILLHLINDILDFSKIEAHMLDLESINFDLRITLEDTVDILAIVAAEKSLELICMIDPAIPSQLKGDPGRLRQILTNLIGNAIKFTTVGEVVINAKLESAGNGHFTIRFSVCDTGIGIPADRLDAIFTPFTQVDGSITRKFGGTGLGLSISKKLAEMMGGEVGIESVVGKGSTFWFTARFEQPIGYQPVSEPRAELTGAKILVVDDNNTNLMLMVSLLSGWGCRYETASDGVTATAIMRKALEQADPFQIALIDQQMPGMDGITLGRLIKSDKLLETAALVMVTSMGQRGDAVMLEQIGFAGYLNKPVRKSQLYDCLAIVLGRASIAAKKPENGIVTRHTVEESAARGIRILVAEDNIINQKVAQKMLNSLGYKVDVVANGLEAVKALELINYDLVLMDCQMPEMDGFTATSAIRGEQSKVTNHAIPIIAMTANAMIGDEEECLAAGMNDYIAKPVTKAKLAEILPKWLDNSDTKLDKDAAISPPPKQRSPCPSLFDEVELVERLEDRAFVRVILEDSLQEIPELIEELRNLCTNDDCLVIRRQVHTLKGLAGNISAHFLQNCAMHVENAAKVGAIETVRELLPELERQALTTMKMIRESSYGE
ncbi:MAG: response regulator [Desulfuromonadaceae bacterium]|nr:response regulator [Desulfuromonadaceae bacterium]